MDASIASILIVDGISNGAIYALMGMATVLLFAVTRVIFIPQGEYVAFGALTLAMLENGQVPGTVWLLLLAAGAVAVGDAVRAVLQRETPLHILIGVTRTLVVPGAISAVAYVVAPMKLGLLPEAVLSAALVASLGPLVYRLAYESIADAPVLVLLIVSVGVHFALVGLGLLFFGAEGYRNPSFLDVRFTLGPVTLAGQAVIIVIAAAVLMGMLGVFFSRTVRGKALRATAVNRLGARMMGISTSSAGRLSFTLAALIGALSGLLIGPTTTVFYDTGFLIGLKGFVAAVFAGLASFPLTAVGAILVGVIEAFGSFWASSFKEVIVFTSILPILLWRSLRDPHREEH